MDKLVTGVNEYLRSGMLPFYYFGVVLTGIFLYLKYKHLRLTFFILLVFWEGLFIYLTKTYIPFIHEVYKIGIVILGVIIFIKNLSFDIKHLIVVKIFFSIFTIVFIFSFLINDQPFITTLSQYGKKYFLPFLFLFGISRISFTRELGVKYSNLFRDIIISQIVLSLLKLVLLGFGESIVGSITFSGGGLATTLPILSFLFIWINHDGNLNKRDWLIFVGLLVIALASNKRAPVFIMPLLLVIMYSYVDKTKRLISFIKYVPFFLLLVYLGIITNPTLNPERKRFGTFDFEYVIKYSNDYLFGSEKQLKTNSSISYGRGGSLLTFFSSETYNQPTSNLLFGQGLTQVLKNYEEFDNELFNVENKGALNGARTRFISYGLLGLISHLLYGLSLIYIVGKNRFEKVLIGIFLWDYFLYNGQILEHSAMAITFIFIICIYRLKKLQTYVK